MSMPKTPILPEIVYEHQCGCSYNGLLVTIRPEVRFSFYIEQVLICIENRVALVRIGDNSVSSS